MGGKKNKKGAPATPPAKRVKQEDGNWRSPASGFASIFNIMFEKKISTDLIIKVGSGITMRELECHSLVLTGHSPVFESMLSERWLGSETAMSEPTPECSTSSSLQENSTRTVTLSEDDPEFFAAFLKSMYEDWREQDFLNYNNIPAEITPAIAVGVLGLACKYLADHIVRRMEHFIYSFLYQRSAEKTIELFLLFKRPHISLRGHNSARVVRRILNCMTGDAENIFGTTALSKLSHADLSLLVKTNRLQCPENFVYNGCVMWAVEQCKLQNLNPEGKNLRTVLGSVLYLIRFPHLSDMFMTDKVIFSDILSLEEVRELLAYKLNKDCTHLKEKTLKFPTEVRCRPGEHTFERLNCGNLSKDLKDFSSRHGFEIVASEELFMYSIWFFCGDPAINYACTVDVGSKIGEVNETRPIPLQVKKPAEGGRGFWAHFKKHVKIPKDTPVSVSFTISGGSTYFSGEEVAETTKEIAIWGKRTLVLTFRPAPNIPNGLNQAALIGFVTG